MLGQFYLVLQTSLYHDCNPEVVGRTHAINKSTVAPNVMVRTWWIIPRGEESLGGDERKIMLESERTAQERVLKL